MNCLRCHGEMRHLRTEKLQLGQTGWLLGDWPNLLAGALEVDIYICPECGKLEFFRADGQAEPEENRMAQRVCPSCGKSHDLDYPRCPYCKHDYR